MPEPINPYATRDKDGLPELTKLAYRMCALVTRYKPVIVAKYASNIAIMALVTAIEVLCGLLPDAKQAFNSIDDDLSIPPADTGDIAGIDAAAGEDFPPDFAG